MVIRRPVPEEPSAQLHLFQMGGYSYQVLTTNLLLLLTRLNLWRFYNQRARAELIIRELKDAYALGKIPTKDFTANEAFFQIVLLAYNLLNWSKRLCAPVHLQRATLPRLRQRLFVVPAQVVRPGNVLTLSLAPGYAFAADFLNTLRHPAIAAAFLSPGPATAQISRRNQWLPGSHKASFFTPVSRLRVES